MKRRDIGIFGAIIVALAAAGFALGFSLSDSPEPPPETTIPVITEPQVTVRTPGARGPLPYP